jgi:hypothetical protein
MQEHIEEAELPAGQLSRRSILSSGALLALGA